MIYIGDCLEILRTLESGSVQCCVTSPPYWGLRDYGVEGQLGLENTPEEYVARMVEVFREVRRVLREDGTLWLNLGDSYAGGGKGGGSFEAERPGWTARGRIGEHSLKPKDLVGIPWAVAFALRADGWWLRQDIIWHKPNPMPESVRDRCTKAHEYVFLMSKSARYYYDSQSIKDPCVRPDEGGRKTPAVFGGRDKFTEASKQSRLHSGNAYTGTSDGNRNRRSVWTVSTQPFKGAHFATFPPKLIEPCILSGTSDAGACSECGAPYQRITESNRVPTRPGKDTKITGNPIVDGNRDPLRHVTSKTTTGWEKSCECQTKSTVPCIVLDPFNGAGTTGLVSHRHGREYVGIELNPEYAAITEARIQAERDRTPLLNTVAT